MFKPVLRTNILRLAPATLSRARFPAQRFLSQEARSKIQEAVNGNPVVLFMKGTPDAPQCGFSRAVVQILDLNQVPVQKIASYDVLSDTELRSAIKEFSDWPTIPQLYVSGEFVGGCDILLGMHQSGELATLLKNNGVVPKSEDAPATSAPS